MPDFGLAVEEEILAIDAILDGIDRIVDAETGLQELRAHILTALWLVERDPEIDAAADTLYKKAEKLTRGHLLGFTRPGNWRDLNEAVTHFQSMLLAASPSERAKQAGVVQGES
jgi:hypothetical protein